MSPITHFMVGWAVANAAKLEKRDLMLVALAGVIPDVDGIGIVWDILSRSGRFEYYQQYHHVFGHNIYFGILITAIAFLLAARKRLAAAIVLVSFHLHLLGDYIGSRGYGNDFWAVPYFWPLSKRDYYWGYQWPLNGWQNITITSVLLGFMFYWVWKRGYSPPEMVSSKVDRVFVYALRNRFGPACRGN